MKVSSEASSNVETIRPDGRPKGNKISVKKTSNKFKVGDRRTCFVEQPPLDIHV